MSMKEQAIHELNQSTAPASFGKVYAQRAIALALLELADAIRSIDTHEKRRKE